MASIIVLNGTSSSGKTTLAKALQQQFDEPFLHAGVDNYIFMLPKQYLNQPLWGTLFRYHYSADNKIERIVPCALGQQLISAMHHSVKAIADAGFKVIVDHVILEKSWLDEMRGLFRDHNVWLIGVRCPLNVIEQREIERKDRTLGQAKAQFDVVHKHSDYDCEVDTSLHSPEEAAEYIKNHTQQQQPQQ